jgi:hypothetical protein
VVITYIEQGADEQLLVTGGSAVTSETTTVRLETATPNATIYYTVNGADLSNLSEADQFANSTGELVRQVSTELEVLEISAIAIGPQMLPSPISNGTISLSPFPVVDISAAPEVISENGGTSSLTLSLSRELDTDLTVELSTDGSTYEVEDVSGLPPAGSSFTRTIPAGATEVSFDVTAQPDGSVDEYDNETIVVAVLDDSAYTPAAQSTVTLTIADSRAPVPDIDIRTTTGSVSDDGGSVSLVAETTVVVDYDLEIPVDTAGSTFEPGDLTGFVAAGDSFVLSIPAGSSESAPLSFTANFDLDFEDEVVALSVIDGSLYNPGASADVGITIADFTPDPTVTISSSQTQTSELGETVTFTLTSSHPRLGSTNVLVMPGGTFEPADLSGVTWTSGDGELVVFGDQSTQETVTITTNADAGLDDEFVRLTIVDGSGYVVGSPSVASFTIEEIPPFQYVAYYNFDESTLANQTSPVGTRETMTISQNGTPPEITLAQSAVRLSGEYSNSTSGGDLAAFPLTNQFIDFDKDEFTLYLGFTFEDATSSTQPIIIGGRSGRWFGVKRRASGELEFTFNDNTDPNYPAVVANGTNINPGDRYELVVSVNTGLLTDGLKWTLRNLSTTPISEASGDASLTSPFVWNTNQHEEFLGEDRSNAESFRGLWHDILVVNGELSYNNIRALIAQDTALNP